MKLEKHPRFKNLPSFIKEHKVFKKYDIEKVFPRLGLEDNQEKIYVSKKDKKDHLLDEVQQMLLKQVWDNPFTKVVKAAWRKNRNQFLVDNKLVVPKFIENNKALWKDYHDQDSPLELYSIFDNCGYIDLEKFEDIEHKLTKPDEGLEELVVFSSSPWDIAQMSERGIESCQSWDGGYSEALVGSIIDPFCAIIYLSNGEAWGYNGGGLEMTARSVVRLIENGRKKSIYIEGPYPNDLDDDEYNRIIEIFTRYIKKHLKYNYSIESTITYDNSLKTKIPLSRGVNYLHQYDNEYGDDYTNFISYRDSSLNYNKKLSRIKTTKLKF